MNDIEEENVLPSEKNCNFVHGNRAIISQGSPTTSLPLPDISRTLSFKVLLFKVAL